MKLPAILALLAAARSLAAATPDAPADDWRGEMLAQVNSVRALASRPPLKLDGAADELAQRHSEYQASIDQLTHDDSGGSLGERATRLGIRWSALAENVAVGSLTVEQTVAMWVDSPLHYANLVGQYALAGFGRAAGNATGARETVYWTQDFVQPLPA
ncbi:hypothetical protein LPJ53_003382 [Coemansia erecta]|uniref:SCP domain-containing protein n=1 Tax=Coemansia erecta TaxID=147472 RepID=A0A9W7Y1B0_9FUNG|nr:hypothetical protein LPJ53_003382 [Coemansia erecta]